MSAMQMNSLRRAGKAGRLLLALACFAIFSVALIDTVGAGEEKAEVPGDLPGIETIDGRSILFFIENDEAFLVDSRKAADFNVATIPTSVNCPITSGRALDDEAEVEGAVADLFACQTVFDAPREGNVVVFCNGIHCWRSVKAAMALERMGFTKIFWYRLGMNDWKSKGYPME